MSLVLPSLPAGHELTGAEAGQIITAIQQTYGVRVSTSVTQFVNNSTTLVNVTGMAAVLEASSSYRFYGLFFMSSGTTGDIKLTASAPSGATGFVNASGSGTSDTGALSAQWMGANTAFNSAFSIGGSNLNVAIEYKGVITTTSSGTYQIQYAQNTADAGANTTFWAGSWLTFWKD